MSYDTRNTITIKMGNTLDAKALTKDKEKIMAKSEMIFICHRGSKLNATRK